MKKSAVISACKRYRYELRREWDASKPLLVVCMLNPSTADHERSDPTVTTLIHFARLWGYGGLLIVNLFALRTSKPAELRRSADRLGQQNVHYLSYAIRYAATRGGGRALVAWGAGGSLEERNDWFSAVAGDRGVELICLGVTQGGHPKHPLARGKHRIPRDQQPIVWRKAPA